MFQRLRKLLGVQARPRYRVIAPKSAGTLVIAQSTLSGLRACIEPEIERGHEGVAYLYGQTDGQLTTVIGAIRPEAHTTPGSFSVSAPAVARILRVIADHGLQLVGQAHSHPVDAFHSDGDEDGARIAYQGFVSIVVPEYGRHLPSLAGSATYMFRESHFVDLESTDIHIVSGKLP